MDQPSDPVAERAKQRVGITLKDKWRLDELVGVGGMAAVYSATHRNGMRVAVKMLHTELSIDPEVRSRFLREGYLANKVEHPGAVAVLDDEVAEDGAVFLVMELLEGETLAHRFERKSRSLLIEEILLIADKLLDVLAAAHDKQIVHRDIKPDNIFLTRAGGVKVLDFGIARLREISPHPPKTSATRSGSTMGTPAYMAPEQARARWDEVDARTDLWSVGATIFKLLTGRVVHIADTINEQLLAAMTKPAPPLGTLVPTVPIPVLEVVDRALLYNREERWSDARAMQRAIRDAYQAITGVAPTSVRLAFDEDDEGVAHADTIVLSSTKMPTSLTAAHDSSSFPKKRGSRPWGKVAWLLTLSLVGIGGYSYLSRRTAVGVNSPFGEIDGGGSSGVLDLGSAPIPSDPAANSVAPVEPNAPSRVETPPVDIDNPESPEAPAPADSATPAAAKSADEPQAVAPRPSAAPTPHAPTPPTTPAVTKTAATATHKATPPAPKPAPPVRRPPPPPPQPQRPYRRP